MWMIQKKSINHSGGYQTLALTVIMVADIRTRYKWIKSNNTGMCCRIYFKCGE